MFKMGGRGIKTYLTFLLQRKMFEFLNLPLDNRESIYLEFGIHNLYLYETSRYRH